MEELKRFTHRKVVMKLCLTDTEFDSWLADLNLGYVGRVCDACGTGMSLEGKAKEGRGRRFRCKKRGCRKKVGYRTGTFFEGAKLSAKAIFEMVYFWSMDCSLTYEQIGHEMLQEDGTSLGTHTIVDWMNFFRDICCEYFVIHPDLLGGVGKIVEVDVALITRKKHNKGPSAGQEWLLGGVERGSSKCFLVSVEQLGADHFLPIIKKFIQPNTLVVSELWSIYSDVKNLPEGYQNLTANDSINFVHPNSNAYATSMEFTWHKFKDEHRKRNETRKDMLLTYISKFVWKKRFKGECFYNFWEQISKLYPVKNPSQVGRK